MTSSTVHRTSEHPAADPAIAAAHFAARLSVETDPADLHTDLAAGAAIVLVDARAPDAFAAGHLPGAINVPHATIDAATTADLPRDRLVVVYCAGPACNASTKGAAKLAALGFPVKELIGGVEYWQRYGYPLELTPPPAAP
ncbi:MAG TPA: rhodanese-like domain-containing protein [Acidimicrobiia bacterium]|nr:rhodanese-like domain-containing protein [Acidimicrobiia bacterium]